MNMLQQLGSHLSGLEQLKTMVEQDLRCGIGETLDIKMLEANEDHVVFEAIPDAHLYNPNNVVHGGFSATMMDFACGYAALSRVGPGQSISTVEIKVSYHRPIDKNTGPIRAEGRVLSGGRRMIFTEARLTDGQGKLLVSATSSVLVIDI